jgi:hypothetical protein
MLFLIKSNFYKVLNKVYLMGKRIRNLTEKVREHYEDCKNHIWEYKKSPLETVKYDCGRVWENVKENHMKRMAGMIAFSGLNMPLKAGLETSSKTLAGWLYEVSPKFYQEGLDLVSRELPDVMTPYFTTTGEEMSDWTSLSTRLFSLGVAYATTDIVIWARKTAFDQAKLDREKKKIREASKYLLDSASVGVIGVPWTYIKYSLMQKATQEVNKAAKTYATGGSVLFDSVFQPLKGWLLDVCVDLAGGDKNERTPKFLSNLSDKSKRILLLGSFGLSALATAGVYAFNDAPFFPSQNESVVESVEENQTRGLISRESLEERLGIMPVLEDVF